MGREIRRVPKGWQHPPYDGNSLRGPQPMHDEVFEDVAAEWLNQAIAWSKGEHPDQQPGGLHARHHRPDEHPFFWQWHGNPPNEKYYRPRWTSEPTCFQIYETETEGTPVSPVFETLEAMIEWLVTDGGRDGKVSRAAAEAFAKSGWVPSMVIGPRGTEMGISAAEGLAPKAGT